ncbi:C-type lectin domain family 7 member A isoform X2 [Sphaeramia orbicularis]|uniref:C-type lectin domain family 7 member A-like n=1 Tax=Sphaeramia orbicularis TaxID=375764 RepID=A0A673AGJ4_9TELE|nr:C-type lectin domain family 7 member A-like isoform X2 [Sphaeramia orbicularis]
MEMQEIPPEKQEIPPEQQKNDDEGTSEPMLEVKTEEKEETEHYTELTSPMEDVYTEAFFGDTQRKKKAGSQTQANIGLWRAACLCLSIICLILLLITVVLGLKLQTGSTVCSDGEKTTDNHAVVERCSMEWCQNHFPEIQPRRLWGRECPKSWLMLDQSCFFLSTYRLSWDESQRNCTNRGGSLTIINSQRVQTFLSKKGNLKYWIGLRERESWTWVDNSPLRESYWSDVPGDGECVTLNTDNPADKNCLSRLSKNLLLHLPAAALS